MIHRNKYVQAVLSLLFLAGAAAAVYYLRNLIYYVLLSLFLAFVGRPLAHWLKVRHIGKVKVPDAIAAAVVILVQLGVIAGLIILVVPLLIKEIQLWSEVDVQSLTSYLEDRVRLYQSIAIQYNLELEPEQLKESLLQSLNLNKLGDMVNSLAGGLSTILIGLFSVVFMTFFFLKEEGLSKALLYAVIHTQHHEKLNNILPKVKKLLSRYFIGLLLQVSIVAILVASGLKIIGLEQILLIALFAGLINVIPYIGPLIGSVVGIVLGAAQNLDLPVNELMPIVGYIAIVFAVTQFIDNFVLQPLIYSNSVNAHPLEIFLVITASGTLAGIGGMIVAVPVYSLFRIIAKEFLSGFQLIQNLTKDV
jgi:predicted PurR-regulated permease PerM